MRLHPRYKIVVEAKREIKEALPSVTDVLSSENMLYYFAEIKLLILKEMGSTVTQALPYAGIPEERRALVSIFYGAKISHGLTDTELYQIITELESTEAAFMLRYERHDSFDKGANEE